MGMNITYLITEIGKEETEPENSAFPDFYFGNDFFIYKRISRIIISICIFIICFLFFIPLVNLFRMQLKTFREKKQIRIDEEEYEKDQLRERLDEEVWEDLVIEEVDEEHASLETMNLLTEIGESSKE